MTQKPVRIAQISDLHIKPSGALAYGRVDTAKALERCVATLNVFSPPPDFVVISGDLADTPTAEEYQYLKRLLAPLKLPFAGIPRNHDSRELMRAAFPSAYAFASGALNQRIEAGRLDLLLLDSSVHRKPLGEFEEPTLRWLDERLRLTGRRCCFCTIRPSRPASGTWIARICSTPAAPNRPVDLDLAQLREPSLKVGPPAFHLHTWFPGDGFGTLVTHQVRLGRLTVRIRFLVRMGNCFRKRICMIAAHNLECRYLRRNLRCACSCSDRDACDALGPPRERADELSGPADQDDRAVGCGECGRCGGADRDAEDGRQYGPAIRDPEPAEG